MCEKRAGRNSYSLFPLLTVIHTHVKNSCIIVYRSIEKCTIKCTFIAYDMRIFIRYSPLRVSILFIDKLCAVFHMTHTRWISLSLCDDLRQMRDTNINNSLKLNTNANDKWVFIKKEKHFLMNKYNITIIRYFIYYEIMMLMVTLILNMSCAAAAAADAQSVHKILWPICVFAIYI